MPDNIEVNYAIGLPPEKAIEYFRSKGYAITFRWSDMWKEAHAKAFTVAKCARLDVLQDIRAAVDKSLAEGQTFREFQKNLTPTLQAKGWWGKQYMTDPLTGQSRPVQLGSPRRLETIYRTNMQSAYVTQSWNSALANREARPYGQWQATHDRNVRASHMALDGKIFPLTDPFWKTHVPGHLDWGCRCRMTTLSEADIKRHNLTVESSKDCISTREVIVSRATGEMRTISVYTDPVTGAQVSTGAGWDYTPAMAAYQPDLNGYDYDIAKRYVEGSVTGPHFKLFYEGKSPCNFPIAVLGEKMRELVGAKAQTVLLSADTLRKNKTNHPEIKLAEYQTVQQLLDAAQLVVKEKEFTLVFIKRGDALYQAVIKATSSGQALFLTSLRVSSLEDAARMRRRGEVVKDELGQ